MTSRIYSLTRCGDWAAVGYRPVNTADRRKTTCNVQTEVPAKVQRQ
jgi:hypothetical protein